MPLGDVVVRLTDAVKWCTVVEVFSYRQKGRIKTWGNDSLTGYSVCARPRD
jgi:hypothetical protein